MKLSLLVLALLPCSAAAAELAVPAQHPLSRYQTMFEKSPFALATAAPPPVVPQAGFAEGWYVSSLSRIFNKDRVTIKSRDLSTQFELFGDEPNRANGDIVLAGVDWSPVVGKSTVTIKKGTEFAKLEFDQQAVQNPVQAQPQMPSVLNRANQPAGMRATLPARPTNLPVTGAQPVTNTQPVVAPSGNEPVTPPTGTEMRRRVRTVPKP